MCEFCETIEEYETAKNNHYQEDYIFKIDNRFMIYVDTGDSFQECWLQGVEYCPYCGKKLCEKK